MVFFIYCSVRDLLVCLPALKVWSVHCHYFSTLCIPNKLSTYFPNAELGNRVMIRVTTALTQRQKFDAWGGVGNFLKMTRRVTRQKYVGTFQKLVAPSCCPLTTSPASCLPPGPNILFDLQLLDWKHEAVIFPLPSPLLYPSLSHGIFCVWAHWREIGSNCGGLGQFEPPSPILHIPRFISGGGGRGP